MEYYDIMLIGKTGTGKSTTADKILIANPRGCDHPGGQHSGKVSDIDDLSVWLSIDCEGKMHLKRLVECRSSNKPHEEVNKMYISAKEATRSCQLLSNETTKVRILDTPGLFGEHGGGSEAETAIEGAATSGLAIMQEILRIQSTMQMQVRRIIYFLPERGPLERSQKALQMELEQMAHYFGKAIFDCMVLVATVSPDIYPHIKPGVIPFSDSDYAKTRENFRSTIRHVLKGMVLPEDKPPVVFISMHDTCEDTLKKITDAPVITNALRLEFHHEVCTRCGIKARVLGEGKKKIIVACYVDQDFIPYEESLCHPMIVPKYSKIARMLGGFAHLVTGNKYAGKWPDFYNNDSEICVECMQGPVTRGCKKINSKYSFKFSQYASILVDHDWVIKQDSDSGDEQTPPNDEEV